MKTIHRFTQIALICALSAAGGLAQAKSFPITEKQRAAAKLAAEEGVPVEQLAKNAPASYKIKRGDTLWAISGVFLKSPWRWPALWGMNMDDVRNPHLIYPGDILYLDIKNGRARLSRTPAVNDEIRLSPSIRIEDQLANTAIPTIPFESIRHFLSRPVMVDSDAFKNSGVVTGAQEGRLNVGTGGRIYASGVIGSPGDRFLVYRAGRQLNDPETGNPLGVESIYLGSARIERMGVQATLDVTDAVQEIGIGDRLLTIPSELEFSFAPHAPEFPVTGSVITLHDGRSGSSLIDGGKLARGYEVEGGKLSVVVLNRGESEGLEVGHVLSLARPGQKSGLRNSMGYRTGSEVAPAIQLPSEEYGVVMVFKTFAEISYAIVMNSSLPVQRGDTLSTPK